MKVRYFITSESITLMHVGVDPFSVTFNNDSLQYQKAVTAVANQDQDTLSDILWSWKEQRTKDIVTITDSRVRYDAESDILLINGKPAFPYATSKIKQLRKHGISIEPILKFVDKLSKNPSFESLQGLLKFVDVNRLPITEDGNIVAYKILKSNMTDCYTGKIDNSVGTVVKMPRESVNPNPTQTCSYGLHICSLSYLYDSGFSGQVLVSVEIDPANFVSLPTDYNSSKARVCEYRVREKIVSNDVKQTIRKLLNNDPLTAAIIVGSDEKITKDNGEKVHAIPCAQRICLYLDNRAEWCSKEQVIEGLSMINSSTVSRTIYKLIQDKRIKFQRKDGKLMLSSK